MLGEAEIKTLGVTTTVRSRTNSDSENTRLSEAMQRARALFSLLGWEQRVRLISPWCFLILRLPMVGLGITLYLIKGTSCFPLLTTSLNQQRIGSRELKKKFFGVPTFLPLFLSPVDMPGLLVTFFDLIPQMAHRGLLFCFHFNEELRDLGFVEISPWYWKMDQPWIDLVKADEKYLDLRIHHQPVELALHNIRTLFRFRCFKN